MRPGIRILGLTVQLLNHFELFFAQFSDVPCCRHSFPHNSILSAILNRISPFRNIYVVLFSDQHPENDLAHLAQSRFLEEGRNVL
jgi:hypothetical protein